MLIFDEAVYAKAQQVQWKDEEFMSKFIVCMREFHASMTYATAIACHFRDAGLQVSVKKCSVKLSLKKDIPQYFKFCFIYYVVIV